MKIQNIALAAALACGRLAASAGAADASGAPEAPAAEPAPAPRGAANPGETPDAGAAERAPASRKTSAPASRRSRARGRPARGRRRPPRYPGGVRPRPMVRLGMRNRWAAAPRDSIERLLTDAGSAAPGYSEAEPPVAVLALDDAAVEGHVGEAAYHYLVSSAVFKFTPQFWDLVPPPYGGRARAGYEAFRGAPRAVWPLDPGYQSYRKAMFAAYADLCGSRGRRECSAWLASLLAGFGEVEVVAAMRDAVEDHLKRPLGLEDVGENAGDARPARPRTGLRKIPEMADLIDKLLKNGFDVWMLSSSNFWAAQFIAAQYGVDPTRVVGVRVRVVNRVLTADALDPVPEGLGESEAMTGAVARGPHLVVGAGKADEFMLQFNPGAGVRVVLDRGDEAFSAEALRLGWVVQPAFAPGPPEIPREAGGAPPAPPPAGPPPGAAP